MTDTIPQRDSSKSLAGTFHFFRVEAKGCRGVSFLVLLAHCGTFCHRPNIRQSSPKKSIKNDSRHFAISA
jgi:hypothetical protein